MPPRYAYWTILVDDQPTAFRAGSQEDLLPTFKRLQAKNPSAKMMWWQNGKLWTSRLDAQEAMRARGEMGRRGDSRQGGFRDRAERPSNRRSGGEYGKPQDERDASGKLAWKPKSDGPERDRTRRSFGGGGKPDRQRSDRPEWKPKSNARPAFKSPDRSRASGPGKLEWRPKGAGASSRPQSFKKDFTTSRPRDLAASKPAKRQWVPKEEYKKSQGIEAKRDKNWRPGGEHKDPRQKYKDAKKAKWGRFKQNIRQKWEGKQGRKKREEG